MLSGGNLAGMSTTRTRVENDFYATPDWATRAILEKEKLGGSVLEPAAGQGHISKVLKEFYPKNEIISTDLIERENKFGISIIGGVDFLSHKWERSFDNVITNPPFNLAQQFIEKALEIATDKVLIFAKLQFLEGVKRKDLFDKAPLKSVYVFRKRVSPLRNGEEFDEQGKPWASTMCFAWFVFQKGYIGEPIIKWID